MSATPPQMQVLPLTRVVKALMIINLVVWILFQLIIEKYFLSENLITGLFALSPQLVLQKYFIWQLGTYMFFHDAESVMHIIFNMLLLWWLGSELEQRWGSRFFLLYYLATGVGAALIYVIGVLLYAIAVGSSTALMVPVVGASGALFGLMLAYGIIFGERIVHFMFLFPMKAKFFVLLLAGIEVLMILAGGFGGSRVANLAHLGGFISGFLFLWLWTRRQKFMAVSQRGKARALKLVVDNEKDPKGPKYWN